MKIDKFLKPARGLLCEYGSDEFSLGRIILWILLGLSIFFWFERPWNQFPTTLSDAFLYALGYNLFKKGISVARTYTNSLNSSNNMNMTQYQNYQNYQNYNNNDTDLTRYNIRDYNS